jgi:hypothetical protein
MFTFNDLGMMRQEAVMKYFKVHLFEGTWKTTKTSVFRLKIKTIIYRIQRIFLNI